MPKITIVPSDGIVIVDGRGFIVPLETPASVHAIQWDGANGWVEYNDGALNAPVTQAVYDSLVVPALAAWEVAREAADAPHPPPPPPTIEEKLSAVEASYAPQFASLDTALLNVLWTGGADEQAQRAELAQRRANLSAKKDEEMMNIIIGG